jgi:hypothetical protein
MVDEEDHSHWVCVGTDTQSQEMVSLEGEKKKISGIRTIKDGDSYWVGGGGGNYSHEGGGRIPLGLN